MQGLIKTPTRSKTNNQRASLNANNTYNNPYKKTNNSQFSSTKKSDSVVRPIIIDTELDWLLPIRRRLKTASSKSRTHSTKASSKPQKNQWVSNFESSSSELRRYQQGMRAHRKKKKKPVAVKLDFSEEAYAELIEDKMHMIQTKRKENQEIQKIIQLLQCSREGMTKRREMLKECQSHLIQESWKAMCGLLQPNPKTRDALTKFITQNAIGYLQAHQQLIQAQNSKLQLLSKGVKLNRALEQR